MFGAAGVALMLAALAAAAPATEVKGMGWRLVGRNRDGADFMQTPYRAGPYMRLKTREELFTRGPGGLSSVKVEEFDCAKGVSRIVSITSYARNNLENKHASIDTPDERWASAEYSAFLPYVCGKKPLPPPNNSTVRPGKAI